MFNRVLILSASAGSGHIRAAQALEGAFGDLGAAREVRHVDTLTYTNRLFRKVYSDAYLDLVNHAPTVLGWLYDRMDRPHSRHSLNTAFNKLNTTPFARMLRRYQPDIAVCTHFLPAEIVSRLKRREKLACPLATTVTDLDCHALWLVRATDHYFVAIDETRALMENLGVEPGRISVTGIPIDPVFAAPGDRPALRRKHGLRPDLTTILVSAGGFGVGPIDPLMDSLAALKHRAQVVVICGRNARLKKNLDTWVAARPIGTDGVLGNVRFHIEGYTTQMHEWMAASDLILGKPGGLTTSEALACGLVMVVVSPIPGQEERNSDHLLEEGAALRCNNLPALAYKIDRLLDDPARLAAMRQNVRRLARPNAAHDIVAKLMTLPSLRPA
jgi:processive 1,2-diacylglycerol beta-glucosyltransferase